MLVFEEAVAPGAELLPSVNSISARCACEIASYVFHIYVFCWFIFIRVSECRNTTMRELCGL